jgi:hypothetical protein
MNPDRLDLGSLRNTVASLEGALLVVADRTWLAAQSANMRNTLIAGVIVLRYEVWRYEVWRYEVWAGAEPA